MKLSRRSDYAMRALMSLASHYGGGPISIRTLALRNDIPKRFLEQIMIDLREQGWVRSVAGRDGGFVLARDPSEITMGAVVRHFDGILAPIPCVSVHGYEQCSQEPVCRFRRVLLEVRNFSARLLERASLAQLLTGQPVSRAEVFDEQLVGGAGI
ncbi:MAG: RrF2 family transcriptional regulator [Planctomycetia bacterium]